MIPKLTRLSILSILSLTVLGLAGPSTAGAAVPLAKTLAENAQVALAQGHFPLATVLLRGAWEISHDRELLHELARAHTMAGHFDEAVEVYEQFLKTSPPAAARKQVETEIARLRSMPAPFSDTLVKQGKATEQATLAFKMGLKLLRARKNDEGVRYLRGALVLDPGLPAPYRILGAHYGKLHDPAKERQFLLDYLRIRPDGPIADSVRARLKDSGVLSTVAADASFGCSIWVNGRDMGRETPTKDLLLPPGSHVISFVNEKYHIVRNMRVKLEAGRKQNVFFGFGVLEPALQPWARVRASGRDLGLWPKIGLPVGHYVFEFVAHDNSRRRTLSARIEAGKVLTVSKW